MSLTTPETIGPQQAAQDLSSWADQVDPTDERYSTLVAHASRVLALLENPVTTANALTVALDDFLGIIYSLLFARQLNYVDRLDSPIDRSPVVTRATQLQAGTVRKDGAWMAGFFFNGALFRLAAAQHRVLKVLVGRHVTNKKAHVPVLLPYAEQDYRSWTGRGWVHTALDELHSEVNVLKHDQDGVHNHRNVAYTTALASAGELLDFLEAGVAEMARARTPRALVESHEQPAAQIERPAAG